MGTSIGARRFSPPGVPRENDYSRWTMRQGDVILLNADAGHIPLPDGMAHCCIASPPYWSLRRYSGDQGRAWPAVSYSPMPGLPALTIPAMTCPLGLEPTVEAYVAHLGLCYREVWRGLMADGGVGVNLW